MDVKVLAPTVETVAVTAALKAAPGYTFAEVKAGAQSALEALFTGGLLGKERDDGEAADAALRCGGRGERASDRTGGGCGGWLDGAANARHGDDQ